MSSNGTASFVVVDEHRLFVDVVSAALRRSRKGKVRVATTEPGALRILRKEHPTVALVSLRFTGSKGEGGLRIAEWILEERPKIKVIGVVHPQDVRTIQWARARGVHGFVTKQDSISALLRLVDEVLRGGRAESEPPRLHQGSARVASDWSPDPLARQLTNRELQVLELLVEGLPGSDIVERLGFSVNTFRTHVKNILHKLHVHSRLEAAAFAVRHDLFDLASGSFGRVP